jgi:hypothetical protein
MTASRRLAVIATGLCIVAATATGAAARDNEADSSVKTDLRYLATEMETYFTDHQSYPGDRAVQYDGRRSVQIGDATHRLKVGDRLGTVRLTRDRDAFCLQVVRVPSASETSEPWLYVSDKGGIIVGSSCPARFTRVSE